MTYSKPSTFDEPHQWRVVADSKDDRVEVLLQWCFDRQVSRIADHKICHQERDVFFVLSEQFDASPVWQCCLTLWDVDQQQECRVQFRLKSK